MSRRLWVIIVNYRTPALAVDCLASLAGEIACFPGSKVLVVDNDSGDGSVANISRAIAERGWGEWAEVVPMARNGGFAYGNNAGLRAALAAADVPDHILLLNPDTVVMPASLAALVAFMEAQPRCGIAGCRIEDGDGSVGCSAHNFPSPLSELEHGACLGPVTRRLRKYVVSPPVRNEAHACDWVSGACMIIRRAVLDQVGLMDDGYFLYFEEVDYCRLTKLAGWEIWYAPEASVMHIEGASTQISDRRRRRPAYWFDSRRRFFVKHYGLFGLFAVDILWMGGRMAYALWCLLTFWSPKGAVIPERFALDLLWGDVRALLTGRLSKIPRVRPRPQGCST